MGNDRHPQHIHIMKKTALITLSIIVLMSTICSCTRKIYIPVQSVRTEYIDRLLHDSIYIADSVNIRTVNDTVFSDKYRYIYKYRITRDSIRINDTLRIPYPVKEIEYINRLNWFQEFSVWAISILLGSGALVLIIWLLKRKFMP